MAVLPPVEQLEYLAQAVRRWCADGGDLTLVATAERPTAIALVRRDVPDPAVDLHELARRHGYRLVFTVFTDSGPRVTALALVRHAGEHNARAVVVPGFEHADAIRRLVTDHAVLITPMRLYPRGHRWVERRLRSERPMDG